MLTPVSDSPFAVLTLIAAPAVFTNASSVLALGTGNRLARVVDRTRQLVRELHGVDIDAATRNLWVSHLGRLEKRGALLVRAMSFSMEPSAASPPPAWFPFSGPASYPRNTNGPLRSLWGSALLPARWDSSASLWAALFW